jgi:LPXTG-motif cell wall-anchored protein
VILQSARQTAPGTFDYSGGVRKETDIPFVSRLRCRTGSGFVWDPGRRAPTKSPHGPQSAGKCRKNMDTNTLLIVVVVLLLLGGGGFFYRRRV